MSAIVQIFEEAQPLGFIAVMLGAALIPMLLMSVTSFVKLSIVFGILRNAIGAGQVPSAAVSSLLAFILSIYIMSPVAEEIFELIDNNQMLSESSLSSKDSEIDIEQTLTEISKLAQPLQCFLIKHSRIEERSFFAKEALEEDIIVDSCVLAPAETWLSLIPAFLLSELREAFAIGFSILLPFLVIDLVVANVLMAMGMMMVSPVTISLPFKILLFLMCDGWLLLCHSLVVSYQ